jgi:hypothetical protein
MQFWLEAGHNACAKKAGHGTFVEQNGIVAVLN